MARIPYTDAQVVAAFTSMKGSIRATASYLEISRWAVKAAIDRAEESGEFNRDKPISGGSAVPHQTIKRPLPKKGEVKYYILTSAQNSTDVHEPFFKNLQAYAKLLGDAEILVARFAYNRAAYLRLQAELTGPLEDDTKQLWYDPLLRPYLTDARIQLAPGCVFCGEVKIIPTAKRPLSGFETFPAGRADGIFPHTKIEMVSVAGVGDQSAKLNYTTGSTTLLNYLQKKAGLQAEFHHSFGACIVEVDSDGDHFVRQISATRDGSFYDVFQGGIVYATKGEVLPGGPVEAINWGDLHARQLDPECYDLAFSKGGIMDTLRPRHQLIHDVLDFNARNHHEAKSFQSAFEKWQRGEEDVREEIIEVKKLLESIARDYCLTVVVDSNHDRALNRWLEEANFKTDPVNAEFYLEAMLHWVREGSNNPQYHTLREALRREGLSSEFLFLGPDDSFVLCGEGGGGGIECGMHGHLGPNGSRGSPLGLSKLGRKANTGHTHSAQIIDGLYVAGTMTKLRMSYNKGPSSWSHSIIVTYPNGKRTIITFRNGKWRAGT